MNVDFRPKTTNVYWRNYESTGKIIVNRGGTRSSKTYSICQLAIRWLLTGRIRKDTVVPTGIFSIVRKTLPALKASAIRDIQEIIHDNNLSNLITYHKTDNMMTVPGSGRYLEFFSVDDAQKVRSRGRKMLYCVEGNELDFMNEFNQLNMRTQGLVFIDLNPDDPYNWINEELEVKRSQKRGDVEVIVSTYKDNPTLPAEQVSEIEYLKDVDDELWQVYGLGQYGKITGLVYPKWNIVDKMPENLSLQAYGHDYGFVNHPSATVYCGIQNRNDLYVDEILYQTNLTNQQIGTYWRENDLKRHLTVYADSAEQKSNQELRLMGFQVYDVEKPAGSVVYGINTIKKYNLFVTKRSFNLQKELRKYKWKVDKNNRTLNEPIKLWDDGLDAMRYYGLKNLSSPFETQSRMSGANWSDM